jgi:phage baseplate assembly protein W
MIKTYYFDFSKRGQDLLGTKDILLLKDDQAIKEAVYNLLYTRIGSVPMHPERGINIERFLFEPADDITASLMEYEIEKGLQTFETRISNISVKVIPAYDESGFEVNISFTVNFTSNLITLNLNFSKIR